jgi:hypothetical protein
MAQWNGQYTGNTHGTKVEDLEEALRHAVEAFRDASDDVKLSKGKAVKKLAARVLNARLKMVKARLSETLPVEAKELQARMVQIEHLRIREENLRSAGIAGIFCEFQVGELVSSDPGSED